MPLSVMNSEKTNSRSKLIG